MKAVQSQVILLFLKADDNLPPIASAMAKICIMEAQNFIKALFGWITATMYSMNAVSGPKSAEQNWRYICHSVRAIFEHLHDVRTAGQFGGEAEQALVSQGQNGTERTVQERFRRASGGDERRML